MSEYSTTKIIQDGRGLGMELSPEDALALGDNPDPRELIELLRKRLEDMPEESDAEKEYKAKVFKQGVDSMRLLLDGLELFYNSGDWEQAIARLAELMKGIDSMGRKLSAQAMRNGDLLDKMLASGFLDEMEVNQETREISGNVVAIPGGYL